MSVDIRKSFVRGTFALSLSVIVTKMLGVFFKVPLSYILGDDGMGYFNTAYAVYGFFYILCTAGVPKSVTLIISRYRADFKSKDYDNTVLKVGLRLFCYIGLFFTVIIGVFAPYIIKIVGNSKALLSLIAVAQSILFVSVSGVLRGYLNSNEKLGTIALSQIVEGVLKVIVGLTLAWFGMRKMMSVDVISALAISGISIGSAVSFVFLIVGAKNNNSNNNTEQNCKIQTKSIGNEIVKNAMPIAISSSLLNLSAALDLTMIIKRLVSSGVSEEAANSIYGNYTTLAVPMFNLVISVLAPIAVSCMPMLSELSFKGDNRGFSETLDKLVFVTLFVSVPASLSFLLYGFDLLDVLFSVQSSALGSDMLSWLSVGLPFYTLLSVVNTAVESKGKIAATVVSLLIGSIVKYVVSYTLIGRIEIGVIGAPIGTVASYIAGLTVSMLILRLSGVRTTAIRRLILLLAVAIPVFILPYKLIYEPSVMRSSFLSMTLSLLVSFLIYAVSVFFIVFIKPKNRVQYAQNEIYTIG